MQILQIIDRLSSVYPNRAQAQQVAYWLLEKLLNLPKAKLLLQNDLQLTSSQKDLLARWLDQMINEHKPLAYILGSVPFLDLDILIEPPILIPRPETEWWVDLLLKKFNSQKQAILKILDLCSGSGCIGLALAKYFSNSRVTLVDISSQACDLIAKNIKYNRLNNAHVIQSDLYNQLSNQKFDLIVANPPYVPADAYSRLDLSVRLWEDRKALVSPQSDLTIISKIIDLAPAYLQKKDDQASQLWVEIDMTQGAQVCKLMQTNFGQVELIVDQFERQRVVVGKN